MPAIVGSNGGYLFTETIPKLQRNPFDKGIVVDPRAYVNSFKETYKLMPGNLIGINTAGDAPALPNMIANHDAMKNFKKETPDFKLFFVDTTKGSIPNDIFISKHLASMNPKNAQSPLFIKEFDGKSYTTQTESTGWGLMSKLAGLEQPMPSTFSSYKGKTIDTALDAAKLRAVEFKLNSLSGNFTSPLPRQSSSLIPGYFTATDRPITELGVLASMVDKGIKSSGSARSALIVSQDTFRTNLLQSELGKYGFQTKVIPPGADPQTAARQWGADVILGVKGTPEMKFPQKTGMPLGNLSQKYPGNDNYRKVQPLLPPDNGGGGGGIVNQNWNWGKQYTPSYQKGALPGGVSTEEIAKAFVDKGNWPVLTTFSLFYK